MIEIKGLTKKNGDKTIINDISLKIDKGVLGILGVEASGKTTLLNIISANTAFDSGEVLIDMKGISRESKKSIGYLLEGAPLFDDLTPSEFLTFIAEAKKVPYEKQYRQITEALDLAELNEVKDNPIYSLSATERKLLGIAQTLLGNPSVIILDDPFLGMDEVAKKSVKTIIKMLGEIKTVIIASRYPSDLLDTCTDIAILSDGKLLAYANSEKLSELAPQISAIMGVSEKEIAVQEDTPPKRR